jgi:multidrug resistance efflux pump
VGDTANLTDGVLLENKNTYQITISLDQIDIIKIRDGMRSSIVLDAFPDMTFSGIVTKVSASPIETA